MDRKRLNLLRARAAAVGREPQEKTKTQISSAEVLQEAPKELPVRVAVHLRPLLENEGASKQDLIQADEVEKTIVVPYSHWAPEPKRFTFDHVFKAKRVEMCEKENEGRQPSDTRAPSQSNQHLDEEDEREPNATKDDVTESKEDSGEAKVKPSSCERLYENCVLPLLDGCFMGINATVLAYGQTGSGKTYTMGTDGDRNGIIPRVAHDLFTRVEKESRPGNEFTISVSFFEIYREVLSDLLQGRTHRVKPSQATKENKDSGLIIREEADKTMFVEGLSHILVESEEDLLRQLSLGCTNRATGSTEMNSFSSRSHAVFTITVQIESKREGVIKTSKFHLVDLAGSERVKKTKSQGERFAEGVDINLGLLALGNVISALGEGRSNTHIPYRDSKLTRILQDSLGGNSRTCMIACISPSQLNFDESINTLRYADRARKIKNKPVENHTLNLEQVVTMLQRHLLKANLQLQNAKMELEKKDKEHREQIARITLAAGRSNSFSKRNRHDTSDAICQTMLEEPPSANSVYSATSQGPTQAVLKLMEVERQNHVVELALAKRDYENHLHELQEQFAALNVHPSCLPRLVRSSEAHIQASQLPAPPALIASQESEGHKRNRRRSSFLAMFRTSMG